MRVIFRIGFLSALISFSAFPEEKKTDKIEVIGNKESAAGSAKGTKTDPGGFVDVIKSESFKDRYVSLPDVLEREAGVRVRRFGGLGSYSTLSIRGSNPNQVQIYIDGVPLSNAQGGEINLSDLNFDNLDRIEIHKSGSASGMSSSSIGGSVNLITKKTDVSRKTRFSVSGGSFNTFKITGSKSGEYKDVKYSIFGQKEKSDQNFTFRSDNGTPVLNTFDDFDTKRRNAQFDRYSLTGTLA
ncbi:MAG TPA: TonB-dependent receptor, partial [Leptospiraceae bacterium]|nr:TonB-dependent receptor [Leptospiraceae bacterium]